MRNLKIEASALRLLHSTNLEDNLLGLELIRDYNKQDMLQAFPGDVRENVSWLTLRSPEEKGGRKEEASGVRIKHFRVNIFSHTIFFNYNKIEQP